MPYDEARPLTLALSEEMVLRYGGGEETPAHPEPFLPPYRDDEDDDRSRCYRLVP